MLLPAISLIEYYYLLRQAENCRVRDPISVVACRPPYHERIHGLFLISVDPCINLNLIGYAHNNPGELNPPDNTELDRYLSMFMIGADLGLRNKKIIGGAKLHPAVF